MYLQQWIDYMGIYRFAGIYGRNKLTTDIINSNPNKFFILNLDDSTNNGIHWICFYYRRKKIEYFDSYGLKPPNIIAQNYSYIYNNVKYQSFSSKACGFYCLYFVYRRYHGMSYYNIVNKFSLVDLDYNQKIIVDFFNNYN